MNYKIDTMMDRFVESIKIMFKNIKKLFIPYLIYIFIFTIIIYLSILLFILAVWFLFLSLENREIYFLFSLGSVLFLLYLVFITFLAIPFYIFITKNIQNIYYGEEITLKQNFSKSFLFFPKVASLFIRGFFSSYLVPIIFSLLSILFGFLLKSFGILLAILSFILFIIFTYSHFMKSMIAIMACIEKEDFRVETYKEYLKISKGKGFHIFGNLFFTQLILGAFFSIIIFFVAVPLFFVNVINSEKSRIEIGVVEKFYSNFFTKMDEKYDIKGYLEENNYELQEEQHEIFEYQNFNIGDFIYEIINILVGAFSSLNLIIFIYLLYKKYEKDYVENELNKTEIDKETFNNTQNI